MDMHASRIALGLLSILIISPTVNAMTYSGSFTGIVEDSRIHAQDPYNAGNIDGERASGTFFIDTTLPADEFSTFSEGGYYRGVPVSLTFSVHGSNLDFPSNTESSISLESTDTGQVFRAGAGDGPYWTAYISFGGDGLFTGNDPATFNTLAVNVAASRASFFAGRDFGGALRLDGLAFEGQVVSTPLPSSWALLMPGLAWMCLMARRRKAYA
jgi:hypothetical protein